MVAVAALSAGLSATGAGAADARPTHPGEPPNLQAVAPDIPHTMDGMVPPPPVPHLRTIPYRAQSPGYPRSVEELREATMPSPTGDPMFDRWPTRLDTRKPGQLLATRDVTATAGFLVTAPIRYARLIKFATTDAIGRPSFGTATILVPRAPSPVRGKPAPIVVNNVPIDSLGTKCTPGYTLSHGYSSDTNSTDLIPPVTQLALSRGYSVLVPDHEGPRMAYAEPTVAAHVILDALRALDHVDRARFGTAPIGLTGYSGGATAGLAATTMAADYAPDIASRLSGAAVGGLPADYRMLVGSMNANLATGLFHAAMFGIARERTELLPLANNLARWLMTSGLKDACTLPLQLTGVTFWPTQLLSKIPDPFHSPAAEEIFRITALGPRRSAAPLYLYHGTYEWWIPAAGARKLFAQQCALGVSVQYHELPLEHVITTYAGWPGALQWLDPTLRGHPQPDGCPRPRR